MGQISKGNWIDLRACSFKVNDIRTFAIGGAIKYKKGDIVMIGLGVAMQIPQGHEALVASRSSTYKHYGLMLVNSLGVIDESYCGDTDEWFAQFIALADGEITKFDRVCQFRIIPSMGKREIFEVEELGNSARGGHGSTGTK